MKKQKAANSISFTNGKSTILPKLVAKLEAKSGIDSNGGSLLSSPFVWRANGRIKCGYIFNRSNDDSNKKKRANLKTDRGTIQWPMCIMFFSCSCPYCFLLLSPAITYTFLQEKRHKTSGTQLNM